MAVRWRCLLVFTAMLVLLTFMAGNAAAKKTIVVTICCGQQERLDWINSIAAEYMKLYPDIEVQWLNAGAAKVSTMVAGGTPPDLIWIGQGWAARVGFYYPLDDFFKKEAAFVNDMIPAMLNEFVYLDGKHYAVPFAAAPRAMACNNDMLQRNGFKMPTARWTWTDAVTMALKSTQDTDGDGAPNDWGIGIYWWPWDFMGYGDSIFKDNGRNANLDQPVIRAAIDLYLDIYSGRRYQVMPTKYIGHDINLQNLFVNGNLALYSVGIFDLPAILQNPELTWDVQEFPLFAWDGQFRQGGSWSAEGYAVWNGENVVEALHFLRFMLDGKNTARLAATGAIIPASRWAVSEAYLKIGKPANLAAFVNGIQYQMSTSAHPAWGDIQTLMWNPIWNTDMSHDGSVPTSMLIEESQRLMQEALDQYFARLKQ